jgi:Heavy-metal resistance protein CzcE
MKNIFYTAVAFFALMAAWPVAAQGFEVNQYLKKTASEGAYTRIITIGPQTKWVNVNYGELVKFVDSASGQSFIWNVDSNEYRLDLASVAPAQMLAGRRVLAYIQPKCDCGHRKS